jgi:hypothetical protein
MRQRGEDGNALLEFVYLAVLLMIPLVYVLITVFYVQRAAFGTTEAAREGARAYAKADSVEEGERRARAAIGLALKDQGVLSGETVGFDCEGTECLAPDSRIKITVTYWVKLPVLGAVFGDDQQGAIKVQASHVEFVDRYRA